MKKVLGCRAIRLLNIVVFSLGISCDHDDSMDPTIDLDRVEKILILGNSITIHKADPKIGWRGNWGMAASKKSKDYVHLFIESLKKKKDGIQFKFVNVSAFEERFWDFDLNQLDTLKQFGADLILIRLGENVSEYEATTRGYSKYLKELIQFLKKDNETFILCTDSFWPKNQVNSQIRSFVAHHKYPLVELHQLFGDSTNTAIFEFENANVAIHPSDRGMEHIAKRLIEVFEID